MNKKIVALILTTAVFIAGCNQNKSDAPKVEKSDAIAEVNGQYISKTSFETLKQQMSQRSPGMSLPDDKLVDELITRELLYQEALKNNLDQSDDFVSQMQAIKIQILTQAALQDYMKNNPVTEEELKAQYEKEIGSKSGTEYKARHILVKTEPEAIAIIAELNKGADFEKLAKAKSTGPSAPQGGDLGWFAANQMVAPFSEAVIALENGKYTNEPVKTQFGWHIILREDSREQTPPPFDAVKEQLKPIVQREKIQKYIEGLRNTAKIEILTTPVEEVEITETETIEAQPVPGDTADGDTAEVVVDEESVTVETKEEFVPVPEKDKTQ